MDLEDKINRGCSAVCFKSDPSEFFHAELQRLNAQMLDGMPGMSRQSMISTSGIKH